MSSEHVPLPASEASADECRESSESRDLEKGVNEQCCDANGILEQSAQNAYFQETWRRIEKVGLTTALMSLSLLLMVVVLAAIDDTMWRTLEKEIKKMVVEMNQMNLRVGSPSPC